MPQLTVLVASTRPGRVGRRIGDWFVARAIAHGGFDRVSLVDLAELALPWYDEPLPAVEGGYLHPHTKRWSAIVTESDAFAFVMPEYNRGFSAPLKNAIDYLYREWHDKPVGLVSYGMMSGGLRAAEMIKPVLVAVKMLPIPEPVAIFLRQSLDADGNLIATSGLAAGADELLDELRRVTEAMASERVPT
ncbi:MAG TPA: NAD(P)H-dependent oxidoreductase [Micromonosporaceae bacterium]